MKANELRIGNYVQSLDDNNIPSLGMELMEIVGIKHNGEGYYNPKHEIGKRYENLNEHGWFSKDCELIGITLTEDILLKCGFEKGSRDKWSIPNYENDFFDYIAQKENKFWYYTGGNFDDIFVGREIKYLHQLQNLYFALTGEELTVNL